MDLQKQIDQRTKGDCGVWFESRGKIWPKDRRKGLISPELNFLQRKAQDVVRKLDEMKLPRRIIGLKPRQRGSTTYFGALDYHTARKESMSACVIGGQYSQTVELWGMLQDLQGE